MYNLDDLLDDIDTKQYLDDLDNGIISPDDLGIDLDFGLLEEVEATE